MSMIAIPMLVLAGLILTVKATAGFLDRNEKGQASQFRPKFRHNCYQPLQCTRNNAHRCEWQFCRSLTP